MTTTAESSTFDLPFQWDDGKFVSPFVSTAEGDLHELQSYLVAAVSVSPKRHSGVVVVDLGCGDGRVVVSLREALCRSLNADVGLVLGRGYDLDAVLIDAARRSVSSLAQPGGEGESPYTFRVCDICAMEPAEVVDEGKFVIVFVYLLTDALMVLKDFLVKILPRVDLFISNCWKVPFFSEHLAGRVGSAWVYRWSHRPQQ